MRLQLVDPVARRRRRVHDVEDARIVHGERGRLGDEVDLVEDDDLRPLGEARAVGGELAVDRVEARLGVLLGIDHVQEQARPLEVGEELVAEARRPRSRPRGGPARRRR